MFQLTRPVMKILLVSAALSMSLGVATPQVPGQVPTPAQPPRVIQFGAVARAMN